jgi:hypothetical protein
MMSEQAKNERVDQIFGGVFLIGLAALFLTGWWWPGMLFVTGIAMLARTYAEGQPLTSNLPALGVLGIGVIFGIEDWLPWLEFANLIPIILIGGGLYLLFGQNFKIKRG